MLIFQGEYESDTSLWLATFYINRRHNDSAVQAKKF